MTNKCIAVLSGTYNEFAEYARNKHGQKMVFCDRWPTFAGLEFSEVVKIGTFENRKDALDIYEHVIPMVRR